MPCLFLTSITSITKDLNYLLYILLIFCFDLQVILGEYQFLIFKYFFIQSFSFLDFQFIFYILIFSVENSLSLFQDFYSLLRFIIKSHYYLFPRAIFRDFEITGHYFPILILNL